MVLHLFRILTRGFARAGTVTLPARTYAHTHTRALSLWPAHSLSHPPLQTSPLAHALKHSLSLLVLNINIHLVGHASTQNILLLIQSRFMA